jgi:hypothetical protein
MPIGVCKLCLLEKDLRFSHFMPGGVYSYLRTDDLEPVVTTSEVMMHSSRETQDYLLCGDCEQLLSRRGEAWVLPRLATIEGAFPLSDLLQKQAPLFDEPDIKAYDVAKNPAIDRNALIHFALGIFWKASVHSWRGSTTDPRIDLGTHSEVLRSHLLYGGGLSEDMALSMTVMPAPVSMISCYDPIRGSNPDFQNFHFYIPGLFFSLSVGNVKDLKATMCLASNPHSHVLVQDMTPELMDLYSQAAGTARKSKKMVELLKKRQNIII